MSYDAGDYLFKDICLDASEPLIKYICIDLFLAWVCWPLLYLLTNTCTPLLKNGQDLFVVNKSVHLPSLDTMMELASTCMGYGQTDKIYMCVTLRTPAHPNRTIQAHSAKKPNWNSTQCGLVSTTARTISGLTNGQNMARAGRDRLLSVRVIQSKKPFSKQHSLWELCTTYTMAWLPMGSFLGTLWSTRELI